MFDLGWAEMAVIALVAIVVIGPRELPLVLRTVGRWLAKARRMARDFQDSMEEIARESDLADMKKELEDASKSVDEELRSIDPSGGFDAAEIDLDRDAPPAKAVSAPEVPPPPGEGAEQAGDANGGAGSGDEGRPAAAPAERR